MRLGPIAALALGLAIAGGAHAAVFSVDALANSSSGGTGLSTIALTVGQAFTVTASTNDLWSAGALPRYSDANGLVAVRLATASDDSGQAVGTQIGGNSGTWTQNGLTAPFGSLVGEIGGVFQLLGTNFSGAAWNAGTLKLYFWDQNNSDNFGNILADVSVRDGVPGGVPEPAAWMLMLTGFGAAGAMLRRRRVTVAA
jgi:hypothetical protein